MDITEESVFFTGFTHPRKHRAGSVFMRGLGHKWQLLAAVSHPIMCSIKHGLNQD